MALSIGIVGLPNVGKSTLFNALTKEQNAEVANYPFATIEPNTAIVPVPDVRMHQIQAITNSKELIHATIEFVDIAGLVKGASQGEGLGNQFLANIRSVDAILHVVRCFEDDNVVHVNARPDPADDIEVINTELALADLVQIEKRIANLERATKADKKLVPVLELAQRMADHVGTGQPLWNFAERDDEHFQTLNREIKFLTAKPVIYVANVDEETLAKGGNPYVEQAQTIAQAQGAGLVMLCAKLENEMAGLSDEEQREYMELSGITESGLDQVIRAGYDLLGLISYFTFNDKEVHAWTVRKGWNAPQAAGVIHTDLQKGFIRAEVMPMEAFLQHKTKDAVRTAGKLRVEGKNYIVEDGDIILFLTSA